MAKTAKAQVAFSSRSKSAARCGYNAAFVQDSVKDVPALPSREAYPKIGGVAGVVNLYASISKVLAGKCFFHKLCVSKVVVHQSSCFLDSLFVQGCKSAVLGNVADQLECDLDGSRRFRFGLRTE